MPTPGTRTMRNRFLGNEERARLRGVVNMLPGFMQRLFPPSDLRRQIRMHPENRDTIDPEWRVRAGKPAPTPEQIADRRAFILYERSLADLESRNWAMAMNNLAESPRDIYIRARTQFAAKMYDQLVENPEITNDIYTNLHQRLYSQYVDGLAEPVTRRAYLTLHGFFNALPPLPQGWNGGRQAREITNRVIPITPEQEIAIVRRSAFDRRRHLVGAYYPVETAAGAASAGAAAGAASAGAATGASRARRQTRGGARKTRKARKTRARRH